MVRALTLSTRLHMAFLFCAMIGVTSGVLGWFWLGEILDKMTATKDEVVDVATEQGGRVAFVAAVRAAQAAVLNAETPEHLRPALERLSVAAAANASTRERSSNVMPSLQRLAQSQEVALKSRETSRILRDTCSALVGKLAAVAEVQASAAQMAAELKTEQCVKDADEIALKGTRQLKAAISEITQTRQRGFSTWRTAFLLRSNCVQLRAWFLMANDPTQAAHAKDVIPKLLAACKKEAVALPKNKETEMVTKTCFQMDYFISTLLENMQTMLEAESNVQVARGKLEQLLNRSADGAAHAALWRIVAVCMGARSQQDLEPVARILQSLPAGVSPEVLAVTKSLVEARSTSFSARSEVEAVRKSIQASVETIDEMTHALAIACESETERTMDAACGALSTNVDQAMSSITRGQARLGSMALDSLFTARKCGRLRILAQMLQATLYKAVNTRDAAVLKDAGQQIASLLQELGELAPEIGDSRDAALGAAIRQLENDSQAALAAKKQELDALQNLSVNVREVNGGIAMLEDSTVAMASTLSGNVRERLNRGQLVVTEGQWLLLAAGVLSLIAALLLAWRMAAFLSRPITQITQACRRIALGDTNVAINYASRDELGELAGAFNELVSAQKAKAKTATRIASGDLTGSVAVLSEHDVLGQAFSSMLANLRELIRQCQIAADQVSSGSEQTSAASQSLSQCATEQAVSLEEIANSVANINAQARSSTDSTDNNAEVANALTISTCKTAESGRHNMSEMVEAMNEIHSASHQIARIIKVIDDIAFQTNLLALNASVEAARAGKHGRGFAVVAEEVRSLADRSAKAARETAAMIDTCSKKVAHGQVTAQQAAESFQQIMANINKVAVLVKEIAQASKEQNRSVARISTSLKQLEAITQQNASSSEETATASAELASQSTQLKAMLDHFILPATSDDPAPRTAEVLEPVLA